MTKFNLKRARPERSEKRKFVAGGKELVSLRPRVFPETKAKIEKEADELNVTESLYLNAIIETRDKHKIKKLLDVK
ncbi:MAG: hypothetical protein GY774_16615 [Planctomycetes bacterium]|nr:hypothetical protein [Planctomycetota bacterium]